MKNIIILLMLLTVLIGCSSDQSKQISFNAEKLFHQAETQYKTIAIKPELANPESITELKQAYLEVTDYCWQYIDSLPIEEYFEERASLESIAFLASNRLASIYYSERNYDSSIIILRKLLILENLAGTALLTTKGNLARAIQASGDWNETRSIYHSMIDTFFPPIDSNKIIYEVFNLPLELIKTDQLLRLDELVKEDIKSGEEYYKRLINEWPNSLLEDAARTKIAELYAIIEKWDKSIENLSLIKDSTGQIDIQAAGKMAQIYISGKKEYQAGIDIYENLIKRVSETNLLSAIYAKMAIAYFEDKNYRKCREIMLSLKDDYPKFYLNEPVPQKYIARCFEMEDNWERAENEYQWLISNFSGTEEAFDAYLSIAAHYEKIKNNSLKELWYNRAEKFYDEMAQRYAGSNIEVSAISYKAEIARRTGDWEKAAKQLEEIHHKFPNSEVSRRALISAANIYRNKLNNTSKADTLINWLNRINSNSLKR